MLGPLDDGLRRWRTFENPASTTEAGGFCYAPPQKTVGGEIEAGNGNCPIPETRVPRIFRAVPYDQVVGNGMGTGDRAQHRALAGRRLKLRRRMPLNEFKLTLPRAAAGQATTKA